MKFTPLKKSEEVETQKALIAKYERMLFKNPFDKMASQKLEFSRKQLVNLIKENNDKH